MITITIPKIPNIMINSTTWNILDRENVQTAQVLKTYAHDISNIFKKTFHFTTLFNKVVFIQAIRHGETDDYPYQPIRVENKPIKINLNSLKFNITTNVISNTLNLVNGKIDILLNSIFKKITVIGSNEYDTFPVLTFDNKSQITIKNSMFGKRYNRGERISLYIQVETYIGLTYTATLKVHGYESNPLTSHRIYINPQEKYIASFATSFNPISVKVYKQDNSLVYENNNSAVIEANKLEFDSSYTFEYKDNVSAYTYDMSTLSSTMIYPISKEFKYNDTIEVVEDSRTIEYDTSYSEELMNNYVYTYSSGKLYATDKAGLSILETDLVLPKYNGNNTIIAVELNKFAICYKDTDNVMNISLYKYGTNYNDITLIKNIQLTNTVRSNVVYSPVNNGFYYLNNDMISMYSLNTDSPIEMEPFNNIQNEVSLINDLVGNIIIIGNSPKSYKYSIEEDSVEEYLTTRSNGYTQFNSVRLDGELVSIKTNGESIEYTENSVWGSTDISITSIKSMLRYRNGTFEVITTGNINGVAGDKTYLYN